MTTARGFGRGAKGGRSIVVLADVDTLKLSDLRQLVEMADSPVDLPHGGHQEALPDDASVSVFTIGKRHGLIVER